MGEISQAEFQDVPSVTGHAVSDKGAYMENPEAILDIDREDGKIAHVSMRVATYISNMTAYLLRTGQQKLSTAKQIEADRQAAKSVPFSTDFFTNIFPQVNGIHPDEDDIKKVVYEANLLAIKMANRFREEIPKGSYVRFITPAFEPTHDQEEHIRMAEAKDPKKVIDQKEREFTEYITNLKYPGSQDGAFPTLAHLVHNVTTNPSFSILKEWLLSDISFTGPLEDTLYLRTKLKHLSEKLELPQIQSLVEDIRDLKPDLLESRAGLFLAFITDLYPYMTYDVRTAVMPQRDKEAILPEFQWHTAVPGGQPDVMALYTPNESDKEAIDAINIYAALSKGTQFGRRPLLGVGEYSEDEFKVVLQVYKLIQEGRIKYILGEIKMIMFDDRVVNDTLIPSVVTEKLKERYKKQMGYREWAAFLHMMSVYLRANTKERGEKATSLLSAIKEVTKHREEGRQGRDQLQRILPIIHDFINPLLDEKDKLNKTILTIGIWPLFEHYEQEKPNNPSTYEKPKKHFHLRSALRYAYWANDGEPRARCRIPSPKLDKFIKLNPREMYRYTRWAGRTILRQKSAEERIKREAQQRVDEKSAPNQDVKPFNPNQDIGLENIMSDILGVDIVDRTEPSDGVVLVGVGNPPDMVKNNNPISVEIPESVSVGSSD